ncbi:hypothetical protein [Bradyrhizobium genosp. SA-3]|uniref:hypothetical protein n=1 Tax=Bradyrhizobium genosp. SA-3 TaxID=508868 RepID=UPI00102969EC|nr:hypothetical protein [Bradyrhizobium genosp. SA-3]
MVTPKDRPTIGTATGFSDFSMMTFCHCVARRVKRLRNSQHRTSETNPSLGGPYPTSALKMQRGPRLREDRRTPVIYVDVSAF